MKHFRQPELKCDPLYDSEGLTEEDRIAIASDAARDRRPGELDGFGICPDCGTNFSANYGVYHCPWCSEDY